MDNMDKAMKQYEVLKWASSFLKTYNREENVATLLLQHHRKMERNVFFQEMQSIIPGDIVQLYKKDIEAHALKGIPIQHLIGYAPFYGEEFAVNEHVLIPRFETEELVEYAAAYIQSIVNREELTIVDVGTGSGVIGITLKQLFPEISVCATDISSQALDVAKQNACQLGVDVQFLQGNFLMPLLQQGIKPDILISNPPYIDYNESDLLEDTVKNFDPDIALFAADKGLSAYRTILEQAATIPQSILRAMFFEIGASQGRAVCEMIQAEFPEGKVEIKKDLAGKDRIVKHVKSVK